MQILISISDPWELGESLRWQPLRGELIESVSDEHGGRALIKLDEAVNYHGSACRYAIASPRHKGNEIGAVQAGKKLVCAFIGISEQQAEVSPLDTKNWRGGLAFIGDLEPAS